MGLVTLLGGIPPFTCLALASLHASSTRNAGHLFTSDYVHRPRLQGFLDVLIESYELVSSVSRAGSIECQTAG